VTTRFSLYSARDFATGDYRRWAIGAAALASVSYTVMAAISIWQSGLVSLEGEPLLAPAAIGCWIGLGFALRGWSSLGAGLTLATSWIELLASYTTSHSFPAPGMLGAAALVAATTLLVGPRPALVITAGTLAFTPVLLLRSPALAGGFPSDAVYWLTLQAVIAFAVWGLLSLTVATLGRMFLAVSEKERQLAATIRYAPDGILVIDRDETVLTANPAAERILGESEQSLAGRSIRRVMAQADVGFDDGVAGAPFPLTVHRADDESFWVEVTSRRMDDGRTQLVLRDVTARVRAEQAARDIAAHLSETQRTEAIGELAGGIAHDFNNLLTAVGGSAELLRAELLDHPQVGLLDDILAAQQRGTTLTRQLLAFARRDVIDPRVFDLSARVAGLQRLLQRVAGEPMRIFCDLTPDCRVRADIGQIEQALVNLVSNARDAMPAGGECAIRVRPASGADGRALVVIEVTDAGVGMTGEVVDRAFDPFFTTKPRGRGTGLGLASVRGITEQSGGRASISSAPGFGTTVTLEFPRSFEAVSQTPVILVAERTTVSSGITILVAEDDDGTRAVVDLILRRAGFDVVLAPDGMQALRVIQHHRKPIHLVVTDVMMPGLTGPKFAVAARALQPDLPILFMSGYPEDALGEVPNLDVARDFIAKPFGSAALLARVDMLLGGVTLA
jgi:two-component system cell cycle sensor histidine kinase/response regulator CckA